MHFSKINHRGNKIIFNEYGNLLFILIKKKFKNLYFWQKKFIIINISLYIYIDHQPEPKINL